MLEQLLLFVNRARGATLKVVLGGGAIFWRFFLVNCCHFHFFDETSDSFSSLKLLFTSCG